jgi:hypothetical protein
VTPDAALVDALTAPVARWMRTLRDCGRSPTEAADLIKQATDQVAAALDNPTTEDPT